MAELAADAVASWDRAEFWHGGATEGIAHAGYAEIARAQMATDLSPALQKAFLNSLTQLEVARSAIEDPDRIARAEAVEDASVYYVAAMWLIYDYPQFGGGQDYIVRAERAAFERRGAPQYSRPLQVVVDRWRAALAQSDESRRRGNWLDFARVMRELGREADAREAVLAAGRAPPDSLLARPLSRRLWEIGEARRAQEVLSTEVKREKIPPARLRLAETARDLGDTAGAAQLLAVATVSVDSFLPDTFGTHRDLVEFWRDATLLGSSLGRQDDARTFADQTYEVATRPHFLRPFSLLDAARAYRSIGDVTRATAIVHEARRAKPGGDDVVALGVVSGAMTYDGMGLTGELLNNAAELLCEMGHFDAALDVARAAAVDNDEGARRLYLCAPDRAELSPDILARELDLGSPYRLLLVSAARHVELGDYAGAASTVEAALATARIKPGEFHRSYNNVLLRLAVAMRHEELVRAVMTRILDDARADDRKAFIDRLGEAASITARWPDGLLGDTAG
jgi:hypothetical protein